MELITEAIARCYPKLESVLDIGCGAGNYTVKLSQKSPDIDVTLVDLSQPMLDKALDRVGTVTQGKVNIHKVKVILGQLISAEKNLMLLLQRLCCIICVTITIGKQHLVSCLVC